MSEALHKRRAERDDRAAVVLGRMAARQEGVVSERQLRALGLDRRTVWRWVRSGRLYPQFPGVYSVGHPAISATGRLIAALFFAGTGAALSHRTAAAWWRLTAQPPAEVHISVPRRTRSVAGILLHHPRSLEPVFHRGLPVTPLPRTLLDLATDASVNELRKALAEADYHHRLDVRELESVTGQGRPGSRRLRIAAAAHMPQLARTETPLEDAFLLLCERFGLPLPEPNVWIAGYRVDALWRTERVVVELDGRAAHSSGARRMTDHRRDLKLRALGHVVRRYSWHQVSTTPEAVAYDLRATLARERSAAQASR